MNKKGTRYTNKRKQYKLVDKETGKTLFYCRLYLTAKDEKKRIERDTFGVKVKILNSRGVEVG